MQSNLSHWPRLQGRGGRGRGWKGVAFGFELQFACPGKCCYKTKNNSISPTELHFDGNSGCRERISRTPWRVELQRNIHGNADAWVATTTKTHWMENVWIYIASFTWLKHFCHTGRCHLTQPVPPTQFRPPVHPAGSSPPVDFRRSSHMVAGHNFPLTNCYS